MVIFLTLLFGPSSFKNTFVSISRGKPMDNYNSKAASRLAGISLRQLQYWDERGFFRPSIKSARGRGSKRLYSFHDLLCLKVIKDLARRGLSLQKIIRCLQPLRQYTIDRDQGLESAKYLSDGEKFFVITSDRNKILDAIEHEFVFSLGIGALVRELHSDLKRTPGKMQRRSIPGVGEKKRASA
jgi:DNA-binding transcriptional MerR regulator